MRKWRIVGLSFEHTHMGDLLREAHEHPNAEIVGVCDDDKARMAEAIAKFAIPGIASIPTSSNACARRIRISPSSVQRPPGTRTWSRRSPRSASTSCSKSRSPHRSPTPTGCLRRQEVGSSLAVNWPLRWYPSHVTTAADRRGRIGDVIEVHYYDGNRGPLYHRADKVIVSDEEVRREKPKSWWYSKAAGGGSLLDYLGYGATLGTWFMDGERRSK